MNSGVYELPLGILDRKEGAELGELLLDAPAQPTADEYRSRFPQQAKVIQTAFESPSKRLKTLSGDDTSVSQESIKTGSFSGTPSARPAAVGRGRCSNASSLASSLATRPRRLTG